VTKWTAIAMWGLLLVCAEIGEAAARGRYSNFGPWPSSHSQPVEYPRRRAPTNTQLRNRCQLLLLDIDDKWSFCGFARSDLSWGKPPGGSRWR
jgi:hypothetical protein